MPLVGRSQKTIGLVRGVGAGLPPRSNRSIAGMINSSSSRMGAPARALALLLLLPALAGAMLPTGEIQFKDTPGYTYCSMAVRGWMIGIGHGHPLLRSIESGGWGGLCLSLQRAPANDELNNHSRPPILNIHRRSGRSSPANPMPRT